jgi:hypothetical protein
VYLNLFCVSQRVHFAHSLPASQRAVIIREVMRTGFQRNRKSSAGELDRSRPYPVHVHIIDSGTEYKISVSNGQSGGIMAGKVEPFTVSTTSGLRRRIVDWLQTNYTQHGLRLGFIYYTTVSQRHPVGFETRDPRLLSTSLAVHSLL